MIVIDDNCPTCGCQLTWEKDTCLGCGTYVGAPNVREVAVERDKLLTRYEKTVEESKARGCFDEVSAFTDSVAKNSSAVINLWPEFLAQFLNGDKSIYSTYALQTDAETRKAAERSNDKERRGTEGTLFGQYGPHIRYAALSLDGGEGLVSYGSCSVSLRQLLCLNTATLMEENSYTFLRRYRLLPGDPIPEARRAVWQDRHYLATVKLADKIDKSMTNGQFAELNIEKLVPAWQTLRATAPVSHIESDSDYEQAIEFLNNLLDVVRDDSAHPLYSLVSVVGDLIEAYENDKEPFNS